MSDLVDCSRNIGRLAYRVEMLDEWKFHAHITAVQIEPCQRLTLLENIRVRIWLEAQMCKDFICDLRTHSAGFGSVEDDFEVVEYDFDFRGTGGVKCATIVRDAFYKEKSEGKGTRRD